MQTTMLNVEGMMCAACVGHVTRALQALGGVQSAQVSLADRLAVVTFDPTKAGVAQMTEAIAEEGYQATPHQNGSSDKPTSGWTG